MFFTLQYYGDKKGLEYEMKVPDFHRERWKTGDWTDDTDQMILIMLSIIDQQGKVKLLWKSWRRERSSDLTKRKR